MKLLCRKIQWVLLLFLTLNVSAQKNKSSILATQVMQISNDPDWQLIVNNNNDFFSRVVRQPSSLSEIWSRGQSNFLLQLNYGPEEYNQKRAATREAALRLLNKFPALNITDGCTGCRQTEEQIMRKIDYFISDLRLRPGIDVQSYLREMESRAIESDEGFTADDNGPRCTWKFFACVIICAATLEFFPAYLSCCALCVCEYCKNPPSWCK